ncbi:MAG TPA: fused MFS/spermidine synthase, partial [Acidimicrobiales bacterium]|nr:fused MFS/spermidine synthase [Acidimicrobiales bacterium]
VLAHGSTTHGLQDPADPGTPLGYYHPDGPIGDVFTTAEDAPPRTVGLIGLGSGALAAYGRPGDTFDFYEIDPAVADIASDPALFTYLSDSDAETSVVLGDGRLTLDRSDAEYDLLVLDAFSSDAIPVHLLTAEALDEYLGHVTGTGLIAIHVSNRYFELAPVIARLADELGLAGRWRLDPSSPELEADGRWSSQWVALAQDPAALDRLTPELGWGSLPSPEGRLWTDDYSDLLGAFAR